MKKRTTDAYIGLSDATLQGQWPKGHVIRNPAISDEENPPILPDSMRRHRGPAKSGGDLVPGLRGGARAVAGEGAEAEALR